MKLWILCPAKDRPTEDDPWKPWYDKSFGFVVRAETEKEASIFADEGAGDENPRSYHQETSTTIRPWLDAKYSTCVLLIPHGESGIIIQDFHAA